MTLSLRQTKVAAVWGLFALLSAQLASLAGSAHARQASATPTVVFLVDGSGSMWGKMEGDSAVKFYAVRDVLRDLLARAPNTARLGFASYGHRRKGDCSDVEIITPAEVGAAARVAEALEQLNPRGKGPVAQGLREVAGTFGPQDTGHIVLIHDNADNCQQDVCAAAADIAKNHPQVAVHVVGLSLPEIEHKRMQCVSATTSGRHLRVTNQTEMADALKQIFELTHLTPDSAPALADALKPSAEPTSPAKGAPGVRLTAALAEGGPMIDAPLRWMISKDGASSDDAPIVERKSAEINEALPPGRYRVAVSHGLVTRQREIEVGAEGPAQARINLDAGVLSFAASASKLGDKLNAPIVTLFALDGQGPAPERPIWIGRQSSGDLVVPKATYMLRVADGLASATTKVDVAAGHSVRRDVVLDTGLLELSAVQAQGGLPVADAVFVIEVDDVDSPVGRREIARSAAPTPRFTLQAGTYYVTVQRGMAATRERVAVSSGDMVKHMMVLPVSRLTVNPSLAGMARPSETPIITRITQADGDSRPVGYSTAVAPTFQLGPGRYKIEAQLGATNVKSAMVFNLQDSDDKTVELQLPVSELTIDAPAVSRSEAGARAAIRDAQGRTVWRSHPGRPLRALLAPGRYTLLVEQAAQRNEQTITLGLGDRHTISLRAEPPAR
jgi:Ca-activated chloride channel family protein